MEGGSQMPDLSLVPGSQMPDLSLGPREKVPNAEPSDF